MTHYCHAMTDLKNRCKNKIVQGKYCWKHTQKGGGKTIKCIKLDNGQLRCDVDDTSRLWYNRWYYCDNEKEERKYDYYECKNNDGNLIDCNKMDKPPLTVNKFCKIKLPIIYNTAGICWYNSILRCLFLVNDFTNYLLTDALYLTILNNNNTSNIIKNFVEIFQVLINNNDLKQEEYKEKVVALRCLLFAGIYKNTAFQDAGETLLKLFDAFSQDYSIKTEIDKIFKVNYSNSMMSNEHNEHILNININNTDIDLKNLVKLSYIQKSSKWLIINFSKGIIDDTRTINYDNKQLEINGKYYELQSIIAFIPGHYISYCKINNKWYIFNDATVIDCPNFPTDGNIKLADTEKSIYYSKFRATVLFYMKVK